MEIKIVITQDEVDQYNERYFAAHPRATKKRINAPCHPTLNWYMTANNIQVNNVKQTWKEFIVDILNKKGLQGLMIEKCEVIYETYFKDRRKRDVDNITPKFIFDGFIEADFIVADDYQHITKLTTICGYDKKNPRIEITVIV